MTKFQKNVDQAGLNYIKETIDKMTKSTGLTPALYKVDFIPKPLPNWRDKSGAENANHVFNAWIDLNKALNLLLVGNNPHRPSKRLRLIHSFNAVEMHKRQFKHKKIPTVPHQHSVIVVSGDLVSKLQSLLELDKEQYLKQKKENKKSESIPYKFKNNTFEKIKYPINSITVTEVYDLEGAINYITKMWEWIWRDEDNDKRMIYPLPSESDFKFKLKDNYTIKPKKIKTMRKKYKEPKTIEDYPENLRGESQNKWGGHKTTRLKTYRQSNTPNGPCRTLTGEEKEAIIRQLEERGEL